MARHRIQRASDHDQIRNMVTAAERCRDCGDFRGAASLFTKTLAKAETFFGRDSHEAATLLNNLGVVCKFLGRFRDAGRYYRRALRILSASEVGPADLAVLYHNLGGLEHARGRFARGEPLARQAVKLREQAHGAKHPDVAGDLVALAALLDQQGQFDEAESLYRRALGIFRRAYGPGHYEIAATENNLAALYQARGDYARALRLYRRALALNAKLLGEHHPDVGVLCNNLATLHKLRGEPTTALPFYQRALAIFEAALGRTHPHTKTCRANLRRLR